MSGENSCSKKESLNEENPDSWTPQATYHESSGSASKPPSGPSEEESKVFFNAEGCEAVGVGNVNSSLNSLTIAGNVSTAFSQDSDTYTSKKKASGTHDFDNKESSVPISSQNSSKAVSSGAIAKKFSPFKTSSEKSLKLPAKPFDNAHERGDISTPNDEPSPLFPGPPPPTPNVSHVETCRTQDSFITNSSLAISNTSSIPSHDIPSLPAVGCSSNSASTGAIKKTSSVPISSSIPHGASASEYNHMNHSAIKSPADSCNSDLSNSSKHLHGNSADYLVHVHSDVLSVEATSGRNYLPDAASFTSKSTTNISSYSPSCSRPSITGTASTVDVPVAAAGILSRSSSSISNISHSPTRSSRPSQPLPSIRLGTNDQQNNAASAVNNLDNDASNARPVVHNVKAGPIYNWQATLTNVKERFKFLFNNEILSDVTFVVGRGEEEQNIPAHKFVLAVGSAVFDAMFNGQLASEQQVINLPDVEPQAFLALLSFLYSDEVQIGPETVMTVLYTAKKYAVPALERRCVDFLKTNLSPDNAFMLLTQARLFDEPQLAALCLKTIDKCTAEAIVAEGFTDIDHDTLTLVLQRDTLRIKELHLYQAVCRWAEAECIRQGFGVSGRQQRSVLGPALKLIRFPLMTVEEFAQGPAQSKILTDAEIVQLFLYFSVNPKPSVDFIDVPRCCMTGKEQTMCRFQSIEARWGYSGTPDRIRFIVDRRIFVVGFGMYGSIHGPSEYEVTIQLIHTLSGKVCGSNETVFTSDGTLNTFRVMFPDPIEVLPNINYTAYATLKGPDSHYGTKGLRKVVVECPSGDRVCFQFSYAAGNNNGTSVEDGQIPEIIFYT